MKDSFSNISDVYLKFRPEFPELLIDNISKLPAKKNLAWDCGTGNGQVAKYLAKHFNHVIATDISKNQIDKAVQLPNIIYKIENAEKSSLENNSVDLIVVAQAIHWFDFDKFYDEAKRVSTEEGIIALIGYPLFVIENEKLNAIINNFYSEIIGKYWDAERRYIDEKYITIPFPFKEFKMPKHEMIYSWKYEQLIGYLSSWSAVGHYKKKLQKNPLELIDAELKAIMVKDFFVTVRFEIIERYGYTKNKFS